MTKDVVSPKISVLIPVYNVEKYAERSIRSVLNQTMQEGVEVIIVNDCTPDNSMEVISELLHLYEMNKVKQKKMKVRIINHDSNRGLAAARITAMSHATGNYIIHIDSDDYIEPDMLEQMYNKAIEENADIVICDYYRTLVHRQKRICQHFMDKESYFREFIEGNHATLWNKLIKKSLYSLSSAKWIEGCDCGEDRICMLTLLYHANKISYIPKAFYHYVNYNSSSITSRFTDKVKRNCLFQIEYIRDFLTEKQLEGYEKSWAYFILNIKVFLLIRCPKEQRASIQNIYPEANTFLASYLKKTSWQNRLLLKGHITTFHVLLYMKNVVKTVLRMN